MGSFGPRATPCLLVSGDLRRCYDVVLPRAGWGGFDGPSIPDFSTYDPSPGRAPSCRDHQCVCHPGQRAAAAHTQLLVWVRVRPAEDVPCRLVPASRDRQKFVVRPKHSWFPLSARRGQCRSSVQARSDIIARESTTNSSSRSQNRSSRRTRSLKNNTVFNTHASHTHPRPRDPFPGAQVCAGRP